MRERSRVVQERESFRKKKMQQGGWHVDTTFIGDLLLLPVLIREQHFLLK